MCKRDIIFGFVVLVAILALSACSKSDGTPPDVPDVPTERYSANVEFSSKVLGTTIKYAIYLPEDYTSNPEKRYGVVYLLHGLGDNHNSWENSLRLSEIVSAKERRAQIEPMIYIMPQGFNSYYVNKFDGSYNYMKMFVEELVPLIDRTYRTTAKAEQRAVIGYSMGGYGAMILPVKNPNIFSVSVPLSMSVRTDEQYMTEAQSGWNSQWGAIFGGYGATGQARLTPYYKQHSPFHLFTAESAASLSRINYFIDSGDDEQQVTVASDELHMLLRELNIKHQYRVRNGEHTSGYWINAMDEALNFVNDCFAKRTYPDEVSVKFPEDIASTLDTKSSAEALNGLNLKIYLPAGYDPAAQRNYHTIYADTQIGEPREVVSSLDSLQRVKPFIMVAYSSGDVANRVTQSQIVEWVDANYRTKANTAGRIAIGQGAGADQLYSADATLFGSLFMTDATLNLPLSLSLPYYYIDITSQGTNFYVANALYLECRKTGKPYEYRVRRGSNSVNSMLAGINNMAYYIGVKLNAQ